MPYFIIDGYNVTRGAERFFRSKPHEEREVLLNFIEREHPQGSTRNRVTVVFDGGPGRNYREPPAGGPRVIFSEQGTADDWIKRLVDHESNPRDVVVVTADKPLSRWVRGAGARVISPVEFVGRARRSRAVGASSEKGPADESVTEELKNLWLKK